MGGVEIVRPATTLPPIRSRRATMPNVNLKGDRPVGIKEGEMVGKRAKTTNLRFLRKAANSLIAFSFLWAGVACSDGGVFDSEFRPIDESGWSKSESLTFELPDTVPCGNKKTYDVELHVRHDGKYPYRDLWLFVDFVGGGVVLERDTVDVELADQYGNWFGSGFGGMMQKSMILKSSVEAGQYEKVILWHCMPVSSVQGLTDVGLSFATNE